MDVSIVPHLKTPLFPHQIHLISAMRQHAQRMTQGFYYNQELVRGKLGIVADPNGTGKTLAVLSYIAVQDKLEPTLGELVPQSNRYFSSHRIPVRCDTSAVNVIIVPAHLLNQWTEEIATHMTRGFKALIIGNRRVLRTPTIMRQIGACDCDVIVTTNRVWPAVYAYTQEHQIRWRNLFIDEAASIVLSVQDGIPAFDFLWLITGDWASFQDRHSVTPLESSAFYRQIVPWTHPLRALCVLKNRTPSYPYPSLMTNRIVCRQQYTLLNLPPSILGTNYDGLTHEKIPGLFQALSIPMWTHTSLNERYGRHELLASKLNDDCSICLDTPQNSTLLSCCMNHFCGSCILRQLIMSGQCPLCRVTLVLADLHPIQQESSENTCLMTKQQATLDYIKRFHTSILVYISYENIYYQFLPLLANQGITCDLIESNVYRFNKAIENFNKGVTRVLFISDLTMIRGVTLKADHLIVFSPLPSYEQVQMLVHSFVRIGQTKNQNNSQKQVVHLTTEAEAEEALEAGEALMAVEAVEAVEAVPTSL